ncbi:MAG: purine-nucleoside phosphorylase [Desulfobacterales bacterium]
MDQREKAVETANFLRRQWNATPRIGLFTGTGLGDTAGMLEDKITLDYAHIPHFPVSTVQSHRGKLVFGGLSGKQVIALQGRFHLYEGYSAEQVTFPIRVMQALGVTTIILTNASGGVNPGFNAGDIMVMIDHINLTGDNPLIGPNIDAWGDRFPDMTAAYDRELIALALQAADKHKAPLQKGVYAGLKGPSLETPAEIRFLRTIGADAVGFSTVLEVIAAVHANIPVLGLSIITNVHIPDAPIPASVEDIIETARKTGPALENIIRHVVEGMSD